MELLCLGSKGGVKMVEGMDLLVLGSKEWVKTVEWLHDRNGLKIPRNEAPQCFYSSEDIPYLHRFHLDYSSMGSVDCGRWDGQGRTINLEQRWPPYVDFKNLTTGEA